MYRRCIEHLQAFIRRSAVKKCQKLGVSFKIRRLRTNSVVRVVDMNVWILEFFKNASSIDLLQLEEICNEGFDLNGPLSREDGQRPLHVAAKNGNLDMVQMLLDVTGNRGQQANIDAPDYSGNTPLYHAAEQGHPEVLKLLIKEGANANMENNQGCTILQIAVCREHLEIVKYLLRVGANVNANTEFDRRLVGTVKNVIQERASALSCAVKVGNVPIIEELLKAGAVVNQQFSLTIHNAVRRGDLELITLLLVHGVDLDGKNIDNVRPLTIAIESGNYEMVEMLLNMEVRLTNLPTEKSSLFVAFQNGHTEIAKLLYRSNAQISVDEMNSTFEIELGSDSNTDLSTVRADPCTSIKGSLIHKSIIDRNIEMTMLLVEKGIDVTAKTSNSGETPLILAIKKQLIPLIKLLLKGMEVSSLCDNHDNRGKTPMYYSTVGSDSSEVSQLLLEAGVPVNGIVCTKTNSTALHSAIHSNNMKVIEFLLLKGADVNAQDWQGNTPFHILLENCEPFDDNYLIFLVAGKLMKKGADPNCKNLERESPLEIAVKKGYFDVVKIILEEGFKIGRDDSLCLKNGLSKITQNNSKPLFSRFISLVAKVYFKGIVFSCNFKDLDTPIHLIEDRQTGNGVKHVQEKHVNLSEIVLHHGNIDTMIKEGFTPLQISMYQGNFELAEYLIGQGANANIRDLYGLLPIHLAIIYGNIDMVEKLYHKKKLDDCHLFGMPLLLSPVHQISVDIVKFFGKRHVFFNAKDENDNTILHTAVSTQNHKLVDFLLEEKINTSAQNRFGDTAFHIALKLRNSEIALRLIEHGVDINTTNLEKSSALHLAASNLLTSVITLMLEKGVKNINLRDSRNLTPLDLVVENIQNQKHTSRNDATDLIILFVKNGASVHSVFWFLVENNLVDMEKVVVECKEILSHETEMLYDSKPFERNDTCTKMPLYLVEFFWSQEFVCQNWIKDLEIYLANAINKNDVTTIKTLLDKKVNLEEYDNLKNKSFLSIFLRPGKKYGLAQVFLDRGVTPTGSVPLVQVVRNGDLSMANILLDKGADVNATFDGKRTALNYAVENGNPKLTKMLVGRGADLSKLGDEDKVPFAELLNDSMKINYRTIYAL